MGLNVLSITIQLICRGLIGTWWTTFAASDIALVFEPGLPPAKRGGHECAVTPCPAPRARTLSLPRTPSVQLRRHVGFVEGSAEAIVAQDAQPVYPFGIYVLALPEQLGRLPADHRQGLPPVLLFQATEDRRHRTRYIRYA